jgi:M6 family metalloprotease-like protein
MQEPLLDGVGNLHLHGEDLGVSTRASRVIGLYVPVSGTVNLLAIPVAFQPDNDPHTTGSGTFPYRTWGPATEPGYLLTRLQRVAGYFNEVSGRRLTLQTTLAPVVTLPRNMASYTDDLYSGDLTRVTSLMRDTVAAAGDSIRYAPYDIVMLIHAGSGMEITLDPHSKDIWSHMMPVSAVLGTGLEITTPDGVTIASWCVVPETLCSDSFLTAANTGMDIVLYEQDRTSYPHAFIPHYWDVVGVWSHELGHAFGMADVYDTSYDGGLSLDRWSLMASGSYLPMPDDDEIPWRVPYSAGRPYFGSSPCHPDAWHKQLLGWSKITNVIGTRRREQIAPQGTTSSTIYRMWTGGNATSKEYFLLENRVRSGYDRYVPESGLMIYHIDDTVGSVIENNLQVDGKHPRILPKSADDTLETEIISVTPRRVVLIPGTDTAFPSSLNNTHFGTDTLPSSRNYLGEPTQVDVRKIELAGGYIFADLQTSEASITFRSPLPGTVLYVTKPTVTVLTRKVDPTSLNVSVEFGGKVFDLMAGQYRFDQITGVLEIPLDETTVGLLPEGQCTVLVSGQDVDMGAPLAEMLTFTVRQKIVRRGLRMISLPVSLPDSARSASMVFVGQAVPRLAWWDASKPVAGQPGQYGGYDQYPELDLDDERGVAGLVGDSRTHFAPAGKAYWIDLRDLPEEVQGCALRLDGDSLSSDHEYGIVLRHGFNMIGNPFNYPVAFSSLLVQHNKHLYNIDEAVAAKLIDPVLYTWDGDSYTLATLREGVIEPWQGYWIYCHALDTPLLTDGTSPAALTLIFTPTSVQNRVRPPNMLAGRQRTSSVRWQMTVQAANMTGLGRAVVTLGVSDTATSRVDAGVDVYAPPAAPDGIQLGSVSDRSGTLLLQDYRAPVESEGYCWNLVVGGAAGSHINLTWSDLTGLPAGYRAVLRDAQTGDERYMNTTTGYTVVFGPQETERQLVIEAAPTQRGALLITGLQAWRTRSTGAATIACQLTTSATVTVEIRTATGRLIKRLPASTRTAGAMTAVWDGKNAQGQLVPRGIYQCQVTAVTHSGQSAKAMTLLPL